MKIKRLLMVVGLLLSASMMLFANHDSNELIKANESIRTIDYDNQCKEENNLFVEFDSHEVNLNGDSINIIAQKKYNRAMFDELDHIGVDNSSNDFIITYEVNYYKEDSKVYLSVRYEAVEGEEDIIEVLEGIVTLNDNLEQDVLFIDDNERFWLSELEDYSRLDNVGFWKIVRKAIKTVSETPIVRTIVNNIATIVAPIIRFYVTSFYLTGAGPIAAWIGAKALNMNQEYEKNFLGIYMPTGIYHANFDCWQKYVGYDDFYDEVFENGTSIFGRKRMERHKYEIDVNGDNVIDYILWAWKGDYYNLGAGCEIGIYERVSDDKYGLTWKCATSKAFNCNLNLKFNNKTIINWDNDGNKHWWFTGFNSNYQFPIINDINDLKATFEVTFNCFDNQKENDLFYEDFHKIYFSMKEDTTSDWKYWSADEDNYSYCNGIKCYIATLSF